MPLIVAGERRGSLVLGAASLLSAVLGSVHAFSVFLAPLETQFGVGRSAISGIYSGALVCLTLSVLLGHRFYARTSAARFVLLTALIGAMGALIAGYAPSVPLVWLGYCVFFGLANGLGYGFGLQIAAQVNPGREGVAMGVVTATYALGAAVSPLLFDMAMGAGGFRFAMICLASSLIAAGGLSAAAMARADARYAKPRPEGTGPALQSTSQQSLILLWVTYFGGVMAGLMVIGHSAGIAAEAEGARYLWLAPALLAVCNLGGSLAGGRLSDTYPARNVLTLLSVLTILALAALAGGPGFVGVLVCLGGVGLAYGGTIAAHPAYIAKRYGEQGSARVYGRIFTAWGAAGLAGPGLAGVLYEASGTYLSAFAVAACFGLVSIASARVFFRSA
ncbi:MAG: MFS transporter [Pseudomonadota bacterium]